MTKSLFLTFAEIEFLLRARPPVLGDLRETLVGMAVERDGEGAWLASDSAGDPDSSTRLTRDGVLVRVGELLPVRAR